MKVKTRFAPSPTGALHIGGVRTALYAYLVAKKNQAEFTLRIEDTDRARLIEGAVEDIIETMNWLGLKPDGEVVYQSKRQKIYQEYAEKLVEEGKAYQEGGAIWFKINTDGVTTITDLVGNRKLEIPNKDQKDFVVLKSDGYPTYHLAHVVDDHLMETNPVIRGPEWISSIPKHIQLFEAFGWEPIPYAHIPIILGPDRSKLSKRHGAKAASEFRKDGYLPEAILNYMAFLGWTAPSGKEILTMEEMIQEFDLKDVHVSNPIFDIVKLDWMNGEYLRKMSDEELSKRLIEFYQGVIEDSEKIKKLAPLVKDRIKTLRDFEALTDFIFESPEYEPETFKKIKADVKSTLDKIYSTLQNLPKPWKAEEFEKTFQDLAKDLGVSNYDIFQLIRLSISGQLVTPPLFESMEILGNEETLRRIKFVLDKYPKFD